VPNRLFRLLTLLISGIPQRVGYAFTDALAPVHYWLFPRRRNSALANLGTMLPDLSPRQRRRKVLSMMRSYNRMLFEFFRLPGLSRSDFESSIEIVGLEHVRDALSRNRGLIVTSCHVGNWELGAVCLAREGYHVNAVAGVQFGRWLAGDVRTAKEALSVTTIAPEDGFRKLWRALSRNEIVALMVDGDVFSPGVTCPFFGRPTAWPSGPGTLAKRTGAPVVAGFCERTSPGSFRVVLEPAIDPVRFAEAAEINAAIATVTERHIREHIEQWCIFRPLWEPAPSPSEEASPDTARARA